MFLIRVIRVYPRPAFHMPDDKIQTAIQNWLPLFLIGDPL
jgi:hypothetical protein